MKKTLLLLFIIFSIVIRAQISSEEDMNYENIDSNSIRKNLRIIELFDLQKSTPTTMRLTEDFEMLLNPNAEAEKTGVIIPRDSLVQVYKYFPKKQYWAAEYHGQWGFISNDKIFPVSKHTLQMNKYDVSPKLRSKISPEYPEEAEKQGIKGKVLLKVYINRRGKITKAKIIEGNKILGESAIKAVKKAKYKPASYQGKKVGAWMNLAFNFE